MEERLREWWGEERGMRALLALLFRQVVGHLWRSREPPKAIVTRNTVALFYADGHWDLFQPEQARQMDYEAEADEAERLQVQYLVTQHGYTPDQAWKRVTQRRERFKDGAWKEERKRWRKALEESRKMSEEEREQLIDQAIALGRQGMQKELASWAPPSYKNCGATGSYETKDWRLQTSDQVQEIYVGGGLGLEAIWKVTWECGSCGHTIERAVKRVI